MDNHGTTQHRGSQVETRQNLSHKNVFIVANSITAYLLAQRRRTKSLSLSSRETSQFMMNLINSRISFASLMNLGAAV